MLLQDVLQLMYVVPFLLFSFVFVCFVVLLYRSQKICYLLVQGRYWCLSTPQ